MLIGKWTVEGALKPGRNLSQGVLPEVLRNVSSALRKEDVMASAKSMA